MSELNDVTDQTSTGQQLIEARISTPDGETARRIAETLVGGSDAACVQILGPMASVYQWKGELHRSNEYLLLVKTIEGAFPRVVDVVREHHRYDIPEVIAVPVNYGLAEYVDWVVAHSGGERAEGEGAGKA
ncbi:divalent-cation tolerance protein CutA [Ornithinimicrobium panacihumi]|uniref:divalent-cation tolerance protein CutA n=1 Tax=Ornithinimicrobium panacihumi TaxID=2008449 RepID=UPI003F8B13B4